MLIDLTDADIDLVDRLHKIALKGRDMTSDECREFEKLTTSACGMVIARLHGARDRIKNSESLKVVK